MEVLTPATVATLVVTVLCALLISAAWTDITQYRIPNILVLAGSLVGLLANTVLPEGRGFSSIEPGALGFWMALAGFATALGTTLPLYILRVVGAGDVKLFAMVGAFLGPRAAISTIVLTLIAGGVLSLAVAARAGSLRQLAGNVRSMLMASYFKLALREAPVVDAPAVSAGKLPYATAIAAGTFTYLLLTMGLHFNVWGFF